MNDSSRRTPEPPQPVRGAEFRRQYARTIAARAKTARRRRGRRPAPQVTGIRIQPPERGGGCGDGRNQP